MILIDTRPSRLKETAASVVGRHKTFLLKKESQHAKSIACGS